MVCLIYNLVDLLLGWKGLGTTCRRYQVFPRQTKSLWLEMTPTVKSGCPTGLSSIQIYPTNVTSPSKFDNTGVHNFPL